MKTLQLKHLAPYIPYYLRVIDEEGKIGILSGFDFNGEPYEISNYTISYNWNVEFDSQSSDWLVFNDGNFISRFKPVLYPISDFQEAISFNGQTIVPINEIDLKAKNKFNQIIHLGNLVEVINKEKGYDFIQHWIFQDLIKWRFDVFHLIPKGLAINVNTLPENPYHNQQISKSVNQ